MEGKANITVGNCHNKDKQKVTLSYFMGPFDNVKEAEKAKFALDRIAETLGADVQTEACIIGEEETEAAMEEAEKVVEEAEESKND